VINDTFLVYNFLVIIVLVVAFLVYGLLFISSGFLIVMFFHEMCYVFICLVLLGDGFPSLVFYSWGFFCLNKKWLTHYSQTCLLTR